MPEKMWHGGAAQKDHKIRKRGQDRWTSRFRSFAGEVDGVPESASHIGLA
jgi:hypothetical protein